MSFENKFTLLYLKRKNFLIHLSQLQIRTAGIILTWSKDLKIWCMQNCSWLCMSHDSYKVILQRFILTIFLVTIPTHAAVLGKRIKLYVLALLDLLRKGVSKISKKNYDNMLIHTYIQCWEIQAFRPVKGQTLDHAKKVPKAKI